jgi:hypothetical protein
MAGAAKLVYVELVAQTKKFNAGLKKADKGLAGMGKAVAAVSAAVIGLGVVMAKSFDKFLDKTANRLDTIGKKAAGLNVPPSFLRELEHAFGIIAGEKVDPVKSLTKIQEDIGEAALGTKTYSDAFLLLGMSYKDVENLKPEEQYLAIIFALQQMDDVNARAVAGNRLLGRSYKKLLPVIEDNTGALEAQLQEAKALGRTPDSVYDLAAAWNDVNAAIQFVKDALGDAIFAEFGAQIVEWKTQAVEWWKGLADEEKAALIEKIITGIKVAMVAVGAAMAIAAGVLLVLAAPLIVIAAKVALVIAGIAAIGSAIYVMWRDSGKIIDEMKAAFAGLVDLLPDFVKKKFGIDVSASSRAVGGTPAPRSAGTTNNNSTSTTVVNIDATGMTENQVWSMIDKSNHVERRGAGR